MSVYVIGQFNVRNRELIEEYRSKVPAVMGPHGARIVAFDESPDVLEGSIPYVATVVIEFPSKAAFRTFYDSPEYREILPLRLRAAEGTLIVADGTPPA